MEDIWGNFQDKITRAVEKYITLRRTWTSQDKLDWMKRF